MKLGKFIKMLDFLTEITLWSPDEPEEPVYEGTVFDIPWHYIDYTIGRPKNDSDEPIYIYPKKDGTAAVMVINVLPPEYTEED